MTDEELRKATYLVRDVVSALTVAMRVFPKSEKLFPSEYKLTRMYGDAKALLTALEAKNAD